MRNFVPRLPSSGESVGRLDKPFSAVYADALVDESNIRAYGAKGDGATDDTGALLAAIAYFDGADATILFQKGEYVIADDVTVPESICLKFEKGAVLKVDDTFTLTINGPIEAGLWRIFDGDGTVTGSPKIEAVYPEWFGAVGDGEADDLAPLNKSFAFADTIVLTSTEYLSSASLSVDGKHIVSKVHSKITKQGVGDYPNLLLGSNVVVDGVVFLSKGTYLTPTGDATSSNYACVVVNGDYNILKKCSFFEIDAYGVNIQEGSHNMVDSCIFENVDPLPAMTRGRYGFMTRKGRFNSVSNSIFKNMAVGICNYSNSEPKSFDNYFNESRDLSFTNNRIENSSEHGMYLASGSYITISNNVVRQASGGVGIKFISSHTTVTGNTIFSSNSDGSGLGGLGITSYSGGSSVISSNVVSAEYIGVTLAASNVEYAHTSQGLTDHIFRDVVVSDNVITCISPSDSAPRVGIRILGQATDPWRLKQGPFRVQGNTIRGFNTGIYFRGISSIEVYDNFLVGEGTYTETDTAYGFGIGFSRLPGGDSDYGCFIKGNHVMKFPHCGIGQEGTSLAVQGAVAIIGNICQACPIGVHNSFGSGATKVIIDSNLMIDNVLNYTSTSVGAPRNTIYGSNTVVSSVDAFELGTTAPSVTKYRGQLYYDTVANKLYINLPVGWKEIQYL